MNDLHAVRDKLHWLQLLFVHLQIALFTLLRRIQFQRKHRRRVYGHFVVERTASGACVRIEYGETITLAIQIEHGVYVARHSGGNVIDAFVPHLE